MEKSIDDRLEALAQKTVHGKPGQEHPSLIFLAGAPVSGKSKLRQAARDAGFLDGAAVTQPFYNELPGYDEHARDRHPEKKVQPVDVDGIQISMEEMYYAYLAKVVEIAALRKVSVVIEDHLDDIRELDELSHTAKVNSADDMHVALLAITPYDYHTFLRYEARSHESSTEPGGSKGMQWSWQAHVNFSRQWYNFAAHYDVALLCRRSNIEPQRRPGVDWSEYAGGRGKRVEPKPPAPLLPIAFYRSKLGEVTEEVTDRNALQDFLNWQILGDFEVSDYLELQTPKLINPTYIKRQGARPEIGIPGDVAAQIKSKYSRTKSLEMPNQASEDFAQRIRSFYEDPRFFAQGPNITR